MIKKNTRYKNKILKFTIYFLLLLLLLVNIFYGIRDGFKKMPIVTALISSNQQDKISVVTSDSNGDLCASPYTDFILPVGSIVPYSNNDIPEGFLLCDGSEISSLYGDLRKLIGYKYANGSSKYLLPDLRGRITKGRITPTNIDNIYDGKEMVEINETNLPAHRHGININNTQGMGVNTGEFIELATYEPGYYITQNKTASSNDLSSYFAPSPYSTKLNSVLTLNKKSGNVIYTDSNIDDNSYHNNIQPTKIVNYIIKY